eukprot:jgi/Tetstr1/421593/TSEL_001178.t1
MTSPTEFRSSFLADLGEAHSLSFSRNPAITGAAPSGGGADGGDEAPLLLVVLNYNLPRVTPLLWQRATYVVAADGGANRLYNEVPDMVAQVFSTEAARDKFVPDAVIGDLDSINPDVRAFYESRGAAIGDYSEDQDTTDLTKCVQACLRHMQSAGLSKEQTTILALGAMGGRLDHTLGNLNVLHSFEGFNLVLCGEGNLTRLIPAGDSVIIPDARMEGPTCGLIPLIGPVTASSTGLEWNL